MLQIVVELSFSCCTLHTTTTNAEMSMASELSDLTTSASLERIYFKACCKPTYRVKWLKNKGAILIIIWSYLVTSVFHLVKSGYDNTPKEQYFRPSGVILVASSLLFPVGGWLADNYVRRYRMIRYSMRIIWICLVFATFSELLAHASEWYEVHAKNTVLYTVAVIIAVVFGGFQSNIVQLGISQLTDASSIQITSFIIWYVLSIFMSGITLQYSTDCVVAAYSSETVDLFYIKLFVTALFLTVAVILDVLCHQWLVKEQVRGNSLKLILKVITYTIKHRHSFSSEGKLISRFNVAKYIYGGPFTSQQVEDVKSILRILAVIVICSIVCGGITPVEYTQDKIRNHLVGPQRCNGLLQCYASSSIHYSDFIITIGLVFLYEFVIFPVFHRCLPKLKITTRFVFGIVFFLFKVLSLLALESTIYYIEQSTPNGTVNKCTFTNKHHHTDVSNKWLIISGFFSGLSTFFYAISLFEFIWAQTPYSMTGLAIGTAYACFGLNTILQSVVGYPFIVIGKIPWENYPLSCQIWYYILQVLIVLIMLAVVITAVKLYKRRTRLESPIHSDSEPLLNQESGPFS